MPIFIAVLCCVGSLLTVQSEPLLRVEKITFNRARLPHTSAVWLEAAIELRGGKNTQESARNPRFIDDIQITLTLAYAEGRQSPQGIAFFQASAEIITLEQGRSRTVHFFLPPEIRKRDRLTDQPDAFLIELSIAGEPLPLRREHHSASLDPTRRLANFRRQLTQQFGQIQGIMQPIYATLFWNATLYPDRLKVAPAYRIPQ